MRLVWETTSLKALTIPRDASLLQGVDTLIFQFKRHSTIRSSWFPQSNGEEIGSLNLRSLPMLWQPATQSESKRPCFSTAVQDKDNDVLEKQHPTYGIFMDRDVAFLIDYNILRDCINFKAKYSQQRFILFKLVVRSPTPPHKVLQANRGDLRNGRIGQHSLHTHPSHSSLWAHFDWLTRR